MPPLISILIPAYNAAEWVGDTIRSALNQTWSNTELIFVDDGSEDETFALASNFASKKVKVVKQTNQGAAAARNHAYSLAQGDFIQWLDADDLLAPEKIELQVHAWESFRNPRLLLSSAWGSFYHQPSRAKYKTTSLWADLAPVEWLSRKLGENLFMQTGTWLVSRELSEAAGPWDVRLTNDDDGEYFCRVILQSEMIKFVPNAKIMYRESGPSSLSYLGESRKKLDSLMLSMELHVHYIRERSDTKQVREACSCYLQTGLSLFYPHRMDLVHRLENLAKKIEIPLEPVRLPWKYKWIKDVFGWAAARRSQATYNRLKSMLRRSWDKYAHGGEYPSAR
jgi:glycosyltransferase involved in cell wall biosynthesis